MQKKSVQKYHLYQKIANGLELQIRNNVLAIGDKLPSLRDFCKLHGTSQTTAIKVYYELESKGLVETRPKSGYFVSGSLKRNPGLPKTSQPGTESSNMPIEVLLEKVYSNAGPVDIALSNAVVADELLPIAKLNKGLVQAMRELKGSGTAYGELQGNERLRRQLARQAFHMPELSHEDIITTSGCVNAISYALMALAKPGDTIAVESPVYFGILQLARSLGLKVMELPTHPQTGIEIDALKKALEANKIDLCLLISNFSNPLGSLMPDEHKKEVVRLIQQYNIPLIEDDIYGDIYFGTSRPNTCKTFDESGLILCCSSVSKTLAPGYRVGWLAPGKFKTEILRLKLFHSITSTNITQEVIANFLETGRYEHHLRKLRNTLHTNSLQYIRAINDYFPEGTKVSRPQGGIVLWVEFDQKIDTLKMYDQAIKRGISIAPGRLFTLQDQFSNCIRLNYGMSWNSKLEKGLRDLADIAGSLNHGS
ncbi:PLP-dependent aminotransferase family protein [Pedobacter cryoconitis]|uniref:DNA-binding transcriptional MocR family regulator n=1 Tax=Pedobacter cryoconitis TaxID=188932 RepID=A0A7X0J6U7_9SPHI|nr:PLP-dependent aminotransferase family protein [Pedobacter cryoconitis]MBB6502176.1 DNA-binding transcriptional MocR family regulator [Pedobacter cryoconitis]